MAQPAIKKLGLSFIFIKLIGDQLRNPCGYICDSYMVAMYEVIVAHSLEPIAKFFMKLIPHSSVLAQHARKRPTCVHELQRECGVQHVEIFTLIASARREQEEVFEDGILPDGFRAAPPTYELKFCDSVIRFQIKIPAGVASPERDILHQLARFQNVGQAQQDSEGMDRDVHLSRDALE